jgi:endoglucanase
MAEKYGEYPNVIYEIWNEPDYFEWEEVKTYSEEVIAVIRAIDPDNIILVGSPHWDQDLHLVAEDPIRDVSNIMYTIHFYAATHEAWLRDRTDEAIAKGIPVSYRSAAARKQWRRTVRHRRMWKTYVDWMEIGNSWVAWSVSTRTNLLHAAPPRLCRGNWTEPAHALGKTDA